MARARNIKPSFFTNEVLGTLDPIVAMTFVGLWCLADRTGRMEDRPLRIKGELFPYRDGLDVNGYLTVLERHGFIDRYDVDGQKYIQVLKFEKHQSPHHTEKGKGYPEKPASNGHSGVLTVKQPSDDCKKQVDERSDSLIPDSLIQKQVAKAPTPKKVDIEKPLGVGQQTWDDWCKLRKAKNATVSQTVVKRAEEESVKAGMTLESFLQTWCLRGSQGLEASWLKPDEKAQAKRTYHDISTMNYTQGVNDDGSF